MDDQSPSFNRRRFLVKGATGLASASATTIALKTLALKPDRVAFAQHRANLPEIQFAISNFIAPAHTFNDGGGDVVLQFGPVFTCFQTMQLTRLPSMTDFQTWHDALESIEAAYPFSPSGVFTFVSYGLPYFNRLPKRLVQAYMPSLRKDPSRFALEESISYPTDYPQQKKKTFNVPVVIEKNDVLLTLRSDSLENIHDILKWLQGSNSLRGKALRSPHFKGLFTFTSSRIMFQQIGLPRKVAHQFHLPYASRVNPKSPMWMGFADQQTSASGPAEIVTFQGNSSARFASLPDDYFKNGAIQHLSHVIQDMSQFYGKDEPYTERVQYMFRSDPIPSLGNPKDQFANGGGPCFFANDASIFLQYREQGVTEASQTGRDIGKLGDGVNKVNDPQPATSPNAGDVGKVRPRMGHLPALQQSSRAPDGTPIHIRMDGPGFDDMDVPDGSIQAKLQFTIFVPTADFFTTMRINQAALKYQQRENANGKSTSLGVEADANGIERFLSATRRQNFLVPPRSHRVFPLRELLD